ncbi:MAG: alpha/beta fold hydrolase [Acidimicrobiales bacterium]
MTNRTRRLTAGPIQMAIAEAGAGGRPLLLVHGFTGAKEDFTGHLPALAAAGWHAVAPDLRGHGASDAPEVESAYSLEIMAGDLLALADALGWGRFALVGHSMGGMVVQVLALSAPERLSALVLMDTGSGPVVIDRSLAMGSVELVRTSGMGALAELLASLPEGVNPLETVASRHVRRARSGPLGDDDPAESWETYGDAKLLAASPAMYAAMVPAMLDQPGRLAAVTDLAVPVLVMVGEHDALFLDDSRSLAAAIPGACLHVLPGAGHSPHHESPDLWLEALLEFLAGNASTPVDD